MMRLLVSVSVVVLALILGMAWYCTKPKETFVFFNKESLQGQFIRQLAEHQATQSQVERASRQFNKALKALLAQYAQKRRVVILDRKQVIAGGRDITAEVAGQLSAAMRSTS